jgi:hypothetical protein
MIQNNKDIINSVSIGKWFCVILKGWKILIQYVWEATFNTDAINKGHSVLFSRKYAFHTPQPTKN